MSGPFKPQASIIGYLSEGSLRSDLGPFYKRFLNYGILIPGF
ncbi:hypothetical protein LEP1GSC061_1255 [Leptospira wolffii serovar Khorat str. Khorat-H2]|nr:hypothetical protein LEP1GSC061_1255 [Leptospira wolffii serovar Khorat str. Khorat-H2]